VSTAIVIVGAGGDGRECLDVIEAVNRRQADTYEVLGFLGDESPDLLGRSDASIIGRIRQLNEIEASYVIGLGHPDRRAEIDRTALREPATLIHPDASFEAEVVLGPGTVLMAGARLSNRIRIGRHVRVDHNSTVSHDVVLGDYVTVRPGANVSRNVVLEDRVTLGSGSVVIQDCHVGRGSTVGAGAVVLHDVPPNTTVAGVPAKPLERR
jgi:sugar O-acyltransferase (sialic acid O-acetyltransferase NeuD family)